RRRTRAGQGRAVRSAREWRRRHRPARPFSPRTRAIAPRPSRTRAHPWVSSLTIRARLLGASMGSLPSADTGTPPGRGDAHEPQAATAHLAAALSGEHALAILAARHHAWRQALDVRADVAWPREPDAIAMRGDVGQRPPELAHAIRPPHDERVERDRAHEGLARRLPQHLVE